MIRSEAGKNAKRNAADCSINEMKHVTFKEEDPVCLRTLLEGARKRNRN
jgi:hypothetical protein